MKKYEWKSIVCILLSLTILTGSIGLRPQQVSAAMFSDKNLYDGELYDYNYGQEGPIRFRVEKGLTFSIGNYAAFHEEDGIGKQMALSMIKGVKYTSRIPDLATVNSKGEVKTKKTGNVIIKAEFKNKSLTFILNIVKKGALTKSGDCKKLKKYVKKLKKAIPEKVNSKNCIDFYTAVQEYENACGKLTKVDRTGRLNKKKVNNYKELAVPEAGWINYAWDLIRFYSKKHNVYKKKLSDYLAVTSMTADAKTDTITVKLKKKLTRDQLFYLKTDMSLTEASDGNHRDWTYVEVSYLWDMTENKRYIGIGTAKLGSREITIQLQDWLNTTGIAPVKEDIIEGHTYQLNARYWCDKMEAVAQ